MASSPLALIETPPPVERPAVERNGAPRPTVRPMPPVPWRPAAPSLIEILLRLALKRRRLLAVWLAVGAVAAIVGVRQFGRQTFAVEGSLIYMSNEDYDLRRLYTPPDIQTIVLLAKSPELAEQLAKEFEFGGPPAALQRQITVQGVKMSQLISVAFEGADADKSARMVNRLMELAMERYAKLRADKLETSLARIDQDYKAAEERRAKAQRAYDEALAEHEVINPRGEIDNLAKELAALDGKLEDSKAARSECEKKLSTLRAFLATAAPEGASGEEASEERLPADRRERILAEELNLKNAKRTLEAKQKQLQEEQRLYRRGAVARKEVEQTANELETAKDTIDKCTRALKVLRQPEAAPMVTGEGDPVRQAQQEKLRLDLELKVLPDRIETYAASLAAKRERLNRLSEAEGQLQPLLREVELAATRVKDLDDHVLRLQGYRSLAQKPDNAELRVFAPATAGGATSSSNHAKLAASILGVSLLLFLGFVAAADLPKARAALAPPQAPDFGVPVLAHLPSSSREPYGAVTPPAEEPVRTLALNIGQGASEPGSIVLFTPVNERVQIDTVVGELARHYARGGEPVLLFDARPGSKESTPPLPVAAPAPAELDAFLCGAADEPGDCFATTQVPAVEFARGELARCVGDGMMGLHRMRQLLDEMRRRYTRVLMIAPPLQEAADLDFLTALSEAVVLVVPDQFSPAQVRPYVRSLRSADAPLCGAVVVPNGMGT
jgi:uncharacterized protein involved in exopolysaccharide biosynthesis